jgi:hypothetical protein
MEDQSIYVLSLFEACETLNKSARTVGRYVRKGLLHPAEIKSRKGTTEYRFSIADIEAFKSREDQTRQETYLSQNEPPAADAIPLIAKAQEPASAAGSTAAISTTPDKTEQTRQPRQKKAEKAMDEKADEARKEEKTEQPEAAKIETPPVKAEEKTAISPDKEIITLLKETTEILRDQLQVKDEQIRSLNGKIDNLIERDRETNILLKGMQDRMILLGKPKDRQEQPERAASDERPDAEAAAEVKYAKESKPKNKNIRDRKEKPEKPEIADKQKKDESPKQKKGFWGGLFG